MSAIDRRTLLKAAPVALVAGMSWEETAMSNNSIRLATINLSFNAVTPAIVQRAIEAMGTSVFLSEGSHDQLYPRVAAGEFDLFAADRAVQAYGLAAAGYPAKPGKPTDWRARNDDTFTANPWQVIPLWMPHFANRRHRLCILDDPKGVFGQPDDAHLVAHTEALQRLDLALIGRFARIDPSADTVSKLDDAIGLSGKPAITVADE